MKVTEITEKKYEVEKNGNKAVIKFDKHTNIFDGRNRLVWMFVYNGKEVICIDKEHAFRMAEARL